MSDAIIVQTLQCSHCGENCEEEPIVWKDTPFCCQGCKAVYEILDKNSLQVYYELEKTPGIPRKADVSRKYDYLDLEEIIHS